MVIRMTRISQLFLITLQLELYTYHVNYFRGRTEVPKQAAGKPGIVETLYKSQLLELRFVFS